MNFLTSFWRKHQLQQTAQDFVEALGKQLRYKRDILPEKSLRELTSFHTDLQAAVKEKNESSLPTLLSKGNNLVSRFLPMDSLEWLREQVEVILVAVVTALAIRAYFYQPFKIPTDSMKPTLYGVQSVTIDHAPPSWLQQRWEQVVLGRLYHAVELQSDATLITMTAGDLGPAKIWFDYTDLTFSNGETHRVWCSIRDLEKQGFCPVRDYIDRDQTPIEYTTQEMALVQKVNDGSMSVRELPPRLYTAHHPLYFYTDAGDQVLVNKWLFNFRHPHQGEVLVFSTANIEGIQASLNQEGIQGSEFYIKRCVGLPGDVLKVQSPLLLVNGSTDGESWTMKRVEAAKDGYRGYGFDSDGRTFPPHYLRTPDDTYTVPANGYWAMGDNSYNSLDSRFWGIVPKENAVGTGTIVWWPFSSRWGFIH